MKTPIFISASLLLPAISYGPAHTGPCAELTVPTQPIRVPEPVGPRLAPAPDHVEGWFYLAHTTEQLHDHLIQLLVAPAACRAHDVEEMRIQRCRLVRREAGCRVSRL